MHEIKVRVVEFGDRKHYQMQFKDPETGRKVTRSTGVERSGLKRERTEAERVAAKWESELREGRYAPKVRMNWEDFRERYEREVLAGLAAATQRKVSGIFDAIEELVNPKRLRDVDAGRLSRYVNELRELKRSENTIKGHLAHLQAALAWAVDLGMLPKVPAIPKTHRAKASKVMKGRPITGEEFDRLLAKVSVVVGEEAAPSWEHYLRGLWLSGLRLAESLELYWDRADKLCVDLTGKRPMLRIPAELEKGHKDRLLPMAPEFAEFLLATPEAERRGRVFRPQARRVHGEHLQAHRVMELIIDIGKKAKVAVNTTPKGVVKYASAHDLRRSFGERWASRVMPQVLMQLMRHESIETTMRFYVGRNAESTADVLWQAHAAAQPKEVAGNKTGNSDGLNTAENAAATSPNVARSKA